MQIIKIKINENSMYLSPITDIVLCQVVTVNLINVHILLCWGVCERAIFMTTLTSAIHGFIINSKNPLKYNKHTLQSSDPRPAGLQQSSALHPHAGVHL